jgi:hypothetical protein
LSEAPPFEVQQMTRLETFFLGLGFVTLGLSVAALA